MSAGDAAGGEVYLKPGEMFLPKRLPAQVRTVLGSCVAVALHDAEQGVTSLCHGIYPRALRHSTVADPSYVEDAIDLMLRWHGQQGRAADRLVAKLFGGAEPSFGVKGMEPVLAVGRSNVEAARRALAAHGVPVVAEDVGGKAGRRLVLHPASGAVRLFRLRSAVEVDRVALQPRSRPCA